MPANGTVEERIVEMRIDNKQFEAGAKRTISILEQLDKGLNALGENNAGNFEKIGSSLDVVTNRFSAMGIVGDQVLRNLTNKATDLVNQLARTSTELSIGQIQPGFNKYSEKTRSVQTIMAATSKDVGTIYDTIEDQMVGVNAQLEKLNWFTDETSYNFLDMVNNIGKFTSVGVSLEDSVTAMEGISTWAAISGATVTEAGRAMYNLSQAMGLGAVKLQDWKSIENANMATLEFKETALETAVALGTLTKTEDGMYQTLAGHTFTTEGFREYMSDDWFSSDVLVQTLKVYGDFTDLLHEAQEAAGIETKEILKHIDAYTENKEAYLSSKDAIEELLPYLDELTSAEYDLGRRAFRAAQEAKTFDEAIDATKDAVSTTWMGIFETIFGSYLEARKFWTEVAESLYNIFAVPVSNLKDIVDQAFADITELLPFKGLNDWLTQLGASVKEFDDAYIHLHGQEEYDALIEEFGSLDRALKLGAIDSDDFHNILVQLASDATGLDFSKTGKEIEGLRKWLTDAGYSYEQFEEAFLKVSSKSNYYGLINMYGSLENAVKNGAITNEMFMDTLSAMAFPEATAEAAASIDTVEEKIKELRQVALDVLNGKYKNGQERRDLLTELGYDPDMIQDLADTLKTNPNADIATIMASKYPEAFEKIAESAGVTKEHMAEIVKLLKDSSDLYEIISFNSDDYISGGEHFKQGLLNLGHVVEQLGEAFQNAFGMIFGDLGDSLYDALASFHAFTEELLLVREYADGTVDDSKLQDVTVVVAGILQIIRAIGTVLGAGFKIIGKIVGFGLRIVGFILPYAANVIWTIADLISGIVDTFAGGGGLASVGGIFLTILQALVSPLFLIVEGVSNLFDFLAQSGLVQTFGTILFAVFGALLSPVLLVANGIVKIFDTLRNSALVAAVKKRFSEFGAKLKLFGDTVRIVVGHSGLKGLFNLLKAYTAEHPKFEKIFNKVIAFFDAIKKPINTVSNSLSSFFTKMKNVAKSIANGYVKNGLAGAMESIHYWTERFLQKHPALDAALDKISSFFRTIGSYMRSAFGVLKSQFGQMRAVYSEKGFAGIFDLFKEHVKAFLAEHPALEKIFNSLYGIYTVIRDAAVRGFTTLRASFPTIDQIGNKITEWKDRIKKNGLFETLRIGITQKIDEIKAAFAGIDFSQADGVLAQIRNFFSAITDWLFGNSETIKQRLDGFIHNIWDWFLEGIRGLKLRDVLGALRLVKIASLLLSFADLLHVITGIGREAKAVPETINETFKNIGTSIKGAFDSATSLFDRTRLMTLAFAVGIVSASLWLLSKIPSDKLVEVAAVIVIVMMVLNRFANSASKISKIQHVNVKNFQVFGTIGSILIGLGILIAAIASAVFKLAYIKDTTTLLYAAGIITAILIVIAIIFGVLIKQLNKISTYKRMDAIGQTLKAIAFSMVIIGIAIGMLARSIGKIAETINAYGGTRTLQSGAVLAGLAGIIIVTLLFMRSMLDSKQKDNDVTPARMTALGTNLIKIAAAMVIVAIAIKSLVIPLAIITALAARFESGIVWSSVGVLAVFALLLGGIMAGMAAIMTKKGTGPEKIAALGTNLIKIAAAMVIVAIAVVLLVIPLIKIVQLFENYHWLTVLAAFGMIVVFFALFSSLMIGMSLILTKKGVGDKTSNAAGTALLKMAAAMLLISVAIMILMRPLKVIVKLMYEYPIGIVWAAAGMIVALVAIIGLIIWAMSKFTPGSGGQIIAIGGAFALIALGINLLVPALAAMIGLASGFVALAGAFEKLGEKAAFLAVITVAMLVLGIAAFFIGSGLLMASVGALVLIAAAWLLAFALEHIAQVMPRVAESMKEFGDMLRDPETLKSIGLAAIVFVVLAAAVIALIFGLSRLFKNTGLGAKFEAFGTTVGKGAKTVISKLGSALVSGGAAMWNKLKDVLVKNLLLILKFLGYMAFTAVLYILDLIPDLVYLLVKGLVDLLNAFAESIRTNSGAILHSITNVISAIIELVVKALYWAVGGVVNLISDFIFDFLLDLVDRAGPVLEFFGLDLSDKISEWRDSAHLRQDERKKFYEQKGIEAAASIQRTLVYGEETEVVRVGGEKRDTEEMLGEAAAMSGYDKNEQFIDGEEIGEETGEAGAEGMAAGYAGGFFSYLKDFGSQFGANADDFSLGGIFGNFLDGNNLDVEDAFGGILGGDGVDLSGMLEGFVGEGGDLSSIGLDNMMLMTGLDEDELQSQIGDKYFSALSGAADSDELSEGAEAVVDGIEENTEEALGKQQGKLTEALIGVAVASAGDMVNAPETKDAMTGSGEYLVDGMAEGVYNGLPKLLNAVDFVSDRAAERFQVKNMIKSPSRLYEKLAGYIPLGVAKGVKKKEGEAEGSITVMASGMLAAMQAAMLKLGMLSDERFDIQPTITPVVDLSEVDSAAGSAGRLFSGIRAGLRGSISIGAESADSVSASMDQNRSNTALLSEVSRLSAKLDELGNRITNMQIVMDTGALVGATAGPMDTALGKINVRRGRGR